MRGGKTFPALGPQMSPLSPSECVLDVFSLIQALQLYVLLICLPTTINVSSRTMTGIPLSSSCQHLITKNWRRRRDQGKWELWSEWSSLLPLWHLWPDCLSGISTVRATSSTLFRLIDSVRRWMRGSKLWGSPITLENMLRGCWNVSRAKLALGCCNTVQG